MSPICSHTDSITITELPDEIAASARYPIARSAEPGEDWSWCYLDNVAFVVRRP